MDEVKIDTFAIEYVEVDVGLLQREHPGLLGLDILKKYKFIIDMGKLELFSLLGKTID